MMDSGWTEAVGQRQDLGEADERDSGTQLRWADIAEVQKLRELIAHLQEGAHAQRRLLIGLVVRGASEALWFR